jgi:hypothetical protein
MADGERLKLRARDTEDYAVVSSVLQDALVAVGDMTWLTDDKRFVMLVNRFRWEQRAPAGDYPDQPAEPAPERGGDARFEDAPLYERVHCGVTFDRVKGVHYRGFAKTNTERILEVLALVADKDGLTVTFAGDAALRLQGTRIVCHMEDLGEPWPTRWRPSHDDAEATDAAEAAGAAEDRGDDRGDGRGTGTP